MSVRQQALATAQIYMKRFYLKVDFRRTNPYLVVATALYLACKMEECHQHIRVVVSEARQTWPGKSNYLPPDRVVLMRKQRISSSRTSPSSANASSR